MQCIMQSEQSSPPVEAYCLNNDSSDESNTNLEVGCFHKDSICETPNGYRRMDDLQKGDQLLTNKNYYAEIKCIVQYECYDYVYLCQVDDLLISPWHPIKINNEWVFPCSIAPIKKYESDYVINIELVNRETIIVVNGINCCTLGHGIEGSVIGHPFYGTNACIEPLKNLEGYQNGRVKVSGVRRNPNTNLVCGYK